MRFLCSMGTGLDLGFACYIWALESGFWNLESGGVGASCGALGEGGEWVVALDGEFVLVF